MIKKLTITITTLAVLLLLPSLGKTETIKLTLEEALQRADAANFDINIARERLAKIESTIGEARSYGLPQVTGTGQYQRNVKLPTLYINNTVVTLGTKNTMTAGVGLTQTLYSAGKVLAAWKAAKSETSRGESELLNTKTEIVLQTKQLFYEILYANKHIAITKKTLKQFNDQLKIIQNRYNDGLESDYTLMRQEVHVSNVEPQLAAAELDRIKLINTLKEVLAIPEYNDLELVGEFEYTNKNIPEEDYVISKALENRDDLRAALAKIETSKHLVTYERGGYLPTLGVGSNLQWQAQSDDFKIGNNEKVYTFNATLNFSMPIFDGLKTHYRMREAKSELKIAKTEEEKLRLDITSQAKNAIAALNEAISLEKSQKAALDLASKSVDIASIRFNNGLMSQFELNDNILQRDQAEKLYARAVFDCLNAEATLERVMGGETKNEDK